MKTASYTILMNLVADGLVDELVIATDDSATWIYSTQWLDRTLAPEPEPEPRVITHLRARRARR